MYSDLPFARRDGGPRDDFERAAISALRAPGGAGEAFVRYEDVDGRRSLRYARAIVMDPQLLFFDEPSAGLDPVVSSALDELILRLRDAMGMTIVVVTHEIASALAIADRIIVLDRGHVIAMGPPDEIQNHPSERVQNLLNRRAEDPEIDPAAYLARLTGAPSTNAGDVHA